MQQPARNNFGLTERDMKTIFNIFQKYPEIKEVLIFGSRAKGNWKTGSDLDLAILNSAVSFKMLLALKSDFAESNLPYKIDLVNLSQLKNNDLIEHIKRVGLLFYSSENIHA